MFQLRRLKVAHFGPYGSAEVSFGERISYIGGANNVGKSSLLRAIALCLTGTTEEADSGRDLGQFRRTGSNRKWSIELDLLDTRSGVVHTLQRVEGDGPRSARQQVIDNLLKLPCHQVRACLYSGELLRNRDAATEIVQALASEGIELPADIRTLLGRHGVNAPAGAVDLNAIEQLYKLAYQKRTAAGRILRELQAATPDPEGLPAEIARMPLDELEDGVMKLASSITTLRTEREQTAAKAQRLAGEPERLRAQVEETKRRLAGLTVPKDDPERAERIADLQQRLAELEPERERIQKVIAEEQAHVQAADAHVAEAKATGTTVKGMSGTCPTCRQEITQSGRARVLSVLKARYEECQKMAEVAREALAAAETALLALPHPGPLRDELQHLQREQADVQRAATERTALEKTLAERERLLAEAEAGASDAAAKAGEHAEQLAQRIAAAEQRHAALSRYVGARAAAERVIAQREKAQREHGESDQLCTALGPDGLRAQAGGRGLAELTAAINATTEPMGYEIDLGAVARRDGPVLVNDRPAHLLSTSERIRVGLGVQAAVARWTGLGIVVVDDADRNVGAALAALQEAIRAAGADLQVIVLSSVRDEAAYRQAAPEWSRASGWSFYAVSAGADGSVIEQLAAAEAAA